MFHPWLPHGKPTVFAHGLASQQYAAHAAHEPREGGAHADLGPSLDPRQAICLHQCIYVYYVIFIYIYTLYNM